MPTPRPQRPPVLLQKLAAALEAPGGPVPGEHLLVAVSGGPDSTALLAALAELAPGRGLRLTAAHVDHGLRGGEGAEEAAQVAALATRLGVGFAGRTIAVGAGADLESRARRARYRALGAMAEEVGATRLVTGHTRDDQVETLLLRLLRGAGRRGLGGMRAAGGRLLRPLLDVSRADVRRFIADRGLTFALDRTNADLRRARNRVRRLLVPFLTTEFNPRVGPALAALAGRLRDEDTFLATAAETRAAAHIAGERLQTAVAEEPPALARRIVRVWVEARIGRGLTAGHVERVLALAWGVGRGSVAVPGGARVLREGDSLVCRPGRAAVARSFRLAITPGETVAHPDGGWRLTLSPPRPRRAGEARAASTARALFDADALGTDLVVRSPEAGDRLGLLGGGTRKLQDVFVDAKVPREARSVVPVLSAGTDILWVAGLVRGRGAALAAGTTRVVEGVLERDG